MGQIMIFRKKRIPNNQGVVSRSI